MLFEKVVVTNSAPFSKALILRGMREAQNHGYNVRERDLRIAWRPRTSRRGESSYLISSLKLYNQMKLAGRGLGKDDIKAYVKDKLISWRN